MIRKAKGFTVVIGLLFAWVILFENLPAVQAKDPDYPTKPIEFILTLSAGGSTDLACRALNKAAGEYLGQPIVTINKPGANGAIAHRYVRKATTDGYTLGNVMGSSLLMPFSEDPPFNNTKDYTWITSFGSYVYILLVRDDAPWKEWGDFIGWAKKNPRGTKLGTTGSKTVDFKAFNMWQIGKQEGADFTIMVYKSSADMLTALLGGHINMYASTIDASTISYLKEKKLRILAFITLPKMPGYENILALSEIYKVTYPNFLGIVGPKGLPDAVVKKLEVAYSKAMTSAEFIKVMNTMHMPITLMDSTALTKYAEENFSETAKVYEKVKADEAKEKK